MASNLDTKGSFGHLVRKIRTANSVFRTYGLTGLVYVLRKKIGVSEVVVANTQAHDGEINAARLKMSEYLAATHNNTVAYGPFKGMTLPENNWWGQLDVGGQILGTYERHVQEKIAELAAPASVFVDIGSADGYFAVGAVKAGLFEHAICFEMSEKGRDVLRDSAANNGIADRVTIFGEVDLKSIVSSISEYPSGVILCDIEGGEFQLLTGKLLQKIRHMHVIVEIHARYLKDGEKLKSKLVDRASQYFDVEFLKRADIQISKYRELEYFNDNDRMLVFSEGRGFAGEWMFLAPKDSSGSGQRLNTPLR